MNRKLERKKHISHATHRSAHPAQTEELIPVYGGYRKLKSFQMAELCFDVTVRFCSRYVEKGSCTRDQMIQAARSGKQNIAEGSKASGISKKIELKLTDIARSSLEELRLDYEDHLREHKLEQWSRQDPRRAELIARRCPTADAVANWVREVRGRLYIEGMDLVDDRDNMDFVNRLRSPPCPRRPTEK